MDKNVAVYLCRGCDIGSALDMDALKEVADDEYSIEICKEHDCLCGDEGRELIAADVKEGVNSIVIGACSPRFMMDAFTFDNVLTTRVNLREQVVWTHEPNDEDTDMMAQDYLRMGIVRGQKASLPEPFLEEVDRTVMVVGGGVTGISAALDAAGAGNDVVLVEKEDQLGGWMAKWAKGIPHAAPYTDPQPLDIGNQIASIEANERITVHTGATIEKIDGMPGQFDVTLKGNGSTPFRVGCHRAGHRVETLRCQQARSLGIRGQPGRHHERPDGRDVGLWDRSRAQATGKPLGALPSSSAPDLVTRIIFPTAQAFVAGSPSNRPSWFGK